MVTMIPDHDRDIVCTTPSDVKPETTLDFGDALRTIGDLLSMIRELSDPDLSIERSRAIRASLAALELIWRPAVTQARVRDGRLWGEMLAGHSAAPRI